MSHVQVQRKTLYFGGRSLDGGITAMGVPGPAVVGGFGVAPGDPDNVTATFTKQDALKHYQRLDVPNKSNTAGSVTAISIAPDSAIACCDIALMGRDGELERHRISPGNPYMGCLDEVDYALVSIPAAIPAVQTGAADIAWDAQRAPGFDVDPAKIINAWPLRLELWRGHGAPVRTHRRARLVAHGIFGANTAGRSLVVCVDGRRRVTVQVTGDGTDFTLTGEAWEPIVRDPLSATFDFVDIVRAESLTFDGATSQALTDGTIKSFDFDGNPMTLVSFKLVAAANSGTCQIRVFAWDD